MHDTRPSMHASECLPCRPQPASALGSGGSTSLPAAHRVFCLGAVRSLDAGVLLQVIARGVSVRVQRHTACCLTTVCGVHSCALAGEWGNRQAQKGLRGENIADAACPGLCLQVSTEDAPSTSEQHSSR